MKDTPENSLIPSTLGAACETGGRSSLDTVSSLTLNLLTSRTVRTKFLLFVSLWVYGIFVTVAQTDSNTGMSLVLCFSNFSGLTG